MIPLDSENRPSAPVEKATAGFATKPHDGRIGDSRIPPEPSRIVGAGPSNADSQTAAFAFSIRERLEQHPCFRGQASLVHVELVEGTLVLSGRLPSYYLKQVLQEALKVMPGVVDVDNQVLVMRPNE